MLGNLLVALDDSAASAAALELALRWAQRFHAELVGMAIVDEPGIWAVEPAWPIGGQPGKDPVYYLGYEAHLKQARHQAEQILGRFTTRCAAAGARHATVLATGRPDETIVHEAQARDLVLLGRGAHFRVSAADDTLSRVLKHAARPVVVVPEPLPPAGPVLIAHDPSHQAARALSAFLSTGLHALGPVHVVAVAARLGRAEPALESALHDLRSQGISPTVHPLTIDQPPAAAILELARQLGAGLLVMGAYGQPVAREFFLGSVTRTVLKESPVPLFLAH
jgi:nucleotide-binding universal stress UspA family protein